MRFLALGTVFALVITGCALRPRYGDFITKQTEGKEARFVVLDTDTNLPVAGAKVEVSELKNRIVATTGADGVFTLPVEKKYLDENSLFAVTLPKGVVSYRVELVKPVAAPAPVEAAPVAPAAPEAIDAGVPPSNG